MRTGGYQNMTLTQAIEALFEPINVQLEQIASSSLIPTNFYSQDGWPLLGLAPGSQEDYFVLAEPRIEWPKVWQALLHFDEHCEFFVEDPRKLTPAEVEYVQRKATEVATRRRALFHPCHDCGKLFPNELTDDNFDGKVICHGCLETIHGVVH